MKRLLLALVISVVAAARLFACGGAFDEAPPLLWLFVDVLPAKSLGQLYREEKPAPAAPPPDFAHELDQLINAVSHDDRAALIGRTDALLAAAREHYRDGSWSNLLHDVRDTLAGEATAPEVAAYLRWRSEHVSWFAQKREEDPSAAEANEIDARAAEAPATLRPHWWFLRGALSFLRGDRVECEPWFRRIVEEASSHPRAEVARFLIARCKLGQSREHPDYTASNYAAAIKALEEQRPARRAEARRAFEEYLQLYPRGRFRADVEGWFGAFAYDAGDGTGALAHYIRQVEDEAHPEVAKSALFMCERILEDTKPEDSPRFALLAEHPLIAIGTTYLVLNAHHDPGEGDLSYKSRDQSARAKRWRQGVLPRVATEVAARREHYKADAWPARYLAILAQAASAAGNQDDALKITSIPTRELQTSDDVLLARGIAFQRSGKSAQAVETFRVLLQRFPQSPLARGVQLKLALALLDAHRAGAALLELKRLQAGVRPEDEEADPYDSSPYPESDAALEITDSPLKRDISAAEGAQIAQLIDTIYNFAPLREIAAALNERELDEALTAEIRAVLAMRYLQEEDFARARRFMSPAQFAVAAEKLARLTTETAALTAPTAKAAKMVELANAWEAARGKLLRAPLGTAETERALFGDRAHQAPLRRRENARALGLKNVDPELEMRDELRHASRWWMRAAKLLPGTALAASARWRALEAMPKIASHSGYAFQRAVETEAASVSRELYERLRADAPQTPEAQRYAAYWTFPDRPAPAYDEFPHYESDWPTAINAVGRMGYRYLDYGTLGVTYDFTQGEEYWSGSEPEPWRSLRTRLLALAAKAKTTERPALRNEVQSLREEARAAYQGRGQANFLAVLDDLALFLQEPDLSSETRAAYFELRLRQSGFIELPKEWDQRDEAEAASKARIEELLVSPALASVPEYVAFLRAYRAGQQQISIPTKDLDKNGDPVVLRTRDYAALEREMRAYLARFPQSRKREAAWLLLARAVHWLTTPLLTTLELREEPPDANGGEHFRTVVNTYWRDKFNWQRATEPLDGYEREFPQGQYLAEMRDYRGAAARLAQKWPLAFDLSLAQLSDTTHPDLQPEAAVRVANLLAELANPEHRAEVLEVVRAQPVAVAALREYLTATWKQQDHPLRYLGAYLADQLGFAYERPQSDAGE